jgi:hypothetical protein
MTLALFQKKDSVYCLGKRHLPPKRVLALHFGEGWRV